MDQMQEQTRDIAKAIERLRRKLQQAEAERNDCIYRRRNMAAAARAQAKMDAIEEQIRELGDAMPRPLSELVPRKTLERNKVVEKIVAVHLAADFLCDCAGVLRETLGKLGLAGCSLFPELKKIESLTNEFVGSACGPEFAGLGGFLTSNEKLIKDMSAIVHAYIADNLDFSNRKRKTTETDNPKNQ